MKRALVAFAISLAGFACSPGQVKVSPQGPGAPVSASGPVGKTQPSGSTGNLVYFEHVETQGAQIDKVAAIGYISTLSQSTQADGIELSSPVDFSPTPILAAGDGRVVYLQSSGLMKDGLVSTAPGSGKPGSVHPFPPDSNQIYQFPSNATQVSINLIKNRVAWVNDAGAASVTDLASGKPQALTVPAGETASVVRVAPSGTQLLVLTSASRLLTFAYGDSGWTSQLNVPSVRTAAWSADGSRIAYVTAKGSLAIDGTATALLESSDVHDLAWSGTSLIYWARLASGNSEIRTLDPASPTEQSLATIHLPSAAGDGIVCPSVDASGTLYYADFSYYTDVARSEYRILRVTSAGTAVVAAAEPGEGFICPLIGPTPTKGDGK